MNRIKLFFINLYIRYLRRKTPRKQTTENDLEAVDNLMDFVKTSILKRGQAFWLGGVLYQVKRVKQNGEVTLTVAGAKHGTKIVRGKRLDKRKNVRKSR